MAFLNSNSEPKRAEPAPRTRRRRGDFFLLRCFSCGHQGADVGVCSFCGWTCCSADARCHKAVFQSPTWGGATGATTPRDLDGWYVNGGRRRR